MDMANAIVDDPLRWVEAGWLAFGIGAAAGDIDRGVCDTARGFRRHYSGNPLVVVGREMGP
jgi:hypothetical protein